MAKYVTEFIGTFFLCLTIGLTVVSGNPMAPLAIGCSLMIMVYMGGPVSGGHFNPAVSLAAMLRGALSSKEYLPYAVSQLLGGMAAGVITGFATGDIASAMPSPDASTPVALLIEFLFTFALCLVVLNTATSRRSKGNSYFGLAIGFTIVVAAFAGGGISGGAFNPAVGIGLGLVDGLLGGAPYGHLWIYLVGPLAGAVVAALVFRLQEGPDEAV